MLRKVHNKKTGKSEWALMSKSTPGKVLEWYGENKPGEGTVRKSESRVQYFKNRGIGGK